MTDPRNSDTIPVTLADVLESADAGDARPAIWTTAGQTTWSQLSQQYSRRLTELGHLGAQRVGLPLTADEHGYATLAALQRLGCDVYLFDALLPAEIQAQWSDQFQLDVVLPKSSPPTTATAVAKPAGSNCPTEGAVTLLTSGTSGQPKAVRHSWRGIARPVRPQPNGHQQRWLLAFRPQLYAGLQVALQAFLNRSTLVVADPTSDPTDIVGLMIEAGIQFASATPSYWRRLLMSVPREQLARVPLDQVTLGGEVADQPILDQLSALYPAARIVHIYATTEMGRCFSVTDGMAGFPARYLEHPTRDGVQLKIVEGQLWVRSRNAMLGYEVAADSSSSQLDGTEGTEKGPRSDNGGDWFPTRDLVERQDDRVYFVGRDSDMINVGGNKVYPVAVERAIRQLVQVADVRIYGAASSVAGQLVACQVVAKPGYAEEDVRMAILDHCRKSLDRYQCPRIVQIVDQLPLTTAGKLVR